MDDIFAIQNQDNAVNNESLIPKELLEPKKEINEVQPKRKMDKILMVQLSLLVLWVVLTTVVYFFGYSIFEPFIKV